MYPRNAAAPEPIAIGAVIAIADGAVQTSGVTVRIKPIGVAEGDGAGTTAYSTDGIVEYTPTQAETNYTSFILIAKKASCIPVAITVVTTASPTPGYAGLDWGKVTNPTTTVGLSGTTVGVVTVNSDMRGTDSAALASVCTETRLAELDAANLPTDVAAVKTDTGNLVTRITSTLFSGITSLAEWLGLIAGKQTGDATALTELKATGAGSGTFSETTDSLEAIRDRGDSAWITSTFSITVGAIADAVWEETLADHLTAGSTGNALNAAGSAGDPWSTALPGAYGSGTAGKIIGDNINATVSSRASQTSVDDVPTNAELATALGTADDAVLAALAALETHGDTTWATATTVTVSDKTGFKLASDGIALVTAWTVNITGNLSGSVGSVTTKTGYKLASDGLDLIVPADPSAIPVLGTSTIVTWIGYFGLWSTAEVNSDADSVNLRNSADSADIAAHATSDDGTVFSSGAAT